MTPTPKVVSFSATLQEQRPQPRKLLGSSLGEDGFCSSETKHDRRTAPRPKLFESVGVYRNKGRNPEKSALGSSPGEDGFFSSETKHDRRTVSRPKQFVSVKKLQEQRSQPQRLLGLSPGGFFSLETKRDRRTMPRPKLFVSARTLQEQRPQPRKYVLSSSPSEDSFCISETKHDRRTVPRLRMIEEWCQDRSCLFEQNITGTKATTPKNMSCIRVLVMMVSVAWKLMMVEDR
jgi:hypothetical protein